MVHQFLPVFLCLSLLATPSCPIRADEEPKATCQTLNSKHCNGLRFSDEKRQEVYCWTEEDRLLFCKEDGNGEEKQKTKQLKPFANQLLTSLAIPCHGNFTFKLGPNWYWLNGTSFFMLDNNSKNWAILPGGDQFLATKYGGFLFRLRPGEAGIGSFCCFAPSDGTVRSYCYEDATYYNLETDKNGDIQKNVPLKKKDVLPYFYQLTDENEQICCWVREEKSDGDSEIIFNGTHWLIWQDGNYQLFTGEFSTRIAACANLLVNSSKNSKPNVYFFISKDTGRGMFHNESETVGCRIQDGTLVFNSASSAEIVPRSRSATASPAEHLHRSASPPASPSPSSTPSSTSKPICRSVSTGLDDDFLSDIFKRGQEKEASRLLSRAFRIRVGTSTTPKSPTNSEGSQKIPKICDPSKQNAGCDDGFICQKMPSSFAISCKMGFCRLATNASVDCPVEEPLQNKTVFGSECRSSNACYTSKCLQGSCSCPKGQRVQAYVDYDRKNDKLKYRELCVSANERTIGNGEICRSSISGNNNVKQCAFGSFCGKCPEFFDNPYVSSKCIAVTAPVPPEVDGNEVAGGNDKAITRTKPPQEKNQQCNCGYLAKCTQVDDVPACICPEGYDFDPETRDCFGWKIINSTECNITCGIDGVRTVARVCDMKGSNGSSPKCEGPEILMLPCIGAEPCPLDSDLVPISVLLTIGSSVLTVELFDEVLEPRLKAEISEAVSAKCVSDSVTYGQCCPSQAWPSNATLDNETADCINNETGVSFMNKFSNGSLFSLFMMVSGDLSSKCCRIGTGGANDIGDVSASRSKRAAISNQQAFDHDTLTAMMTDPAMVTQLSATFGEVDPYATLTKSSITPALTSANSAKTQPMSNIIAENGPTTQPAPINSEVQATPAFFDFQAGFPVWAAGLFAGGIAIGIIGGVTTVVVCIYKKKSAMANKRKVSAIPQREGVEARRRFVLSFDATHQPIERDTYYPSYYTAYPPSGRSRTSHSLVPKSAHEVTGDGDRNQRL